MQQLLVRVLVHHQLVGIIAGGGTPSLVNTISFVTIATTSNTTDFGDLLAARSTLNGSAGETRGLFMGGAEPSTVDTIEYVTIASAGNSTDFGNLTEVDQNLMQLNQLLSYSCS